MLCFMYMSSYMHPLIKDRGVCQLQAPCMAIDRWCHIFHKGCLWKYRHLLFAKMFQKMVFWRYLKNHCSFGLMLQYTTSWDDYAETCIFSALSGQHVKCSDPFKKTQKVVVPVFIQAPHVKYMSTSCILSGMASDKSQAPLSFNRRCI